MDGSAASSAEADTALSDPRAAVDAVWYRGFHPDIAAAGVDPADHYLTLGWQEGRWPNPAFDPGFYKAQVPTAPAADPLLHYLEQGEAAGKRPVAWFDRTSSRASRITSRTGSTAQPAPTRISTPASMRRRTRM